jgi:hypothetical protein
MLSDKNGCAVFIGSMAEASIVFVKVNTTLAPHDIYIVGLKVAFGFRSPCYEAITVLFAPCRFGAACGTTLLSDLGEFGEDSTQLVPMGLPDSCLP